MDDTAVISGKKITASVSGYIWDSPVLKPLVYNPFILALLILALIWIMDFMYDKRFYCDRAAMMVQHLITTYVLIAAGLSMNNILIKHRYRLDKFKEAALAEEEAALATPIINYSVFAPEDQSSSTYLTPNENISSSPSAESPPSKSPPPKSPPS